MKKLILSGAIALAAATSCTGAKAQWNEVAGSAKGERSYAPYIQSPGSGFETSGGASYSVFNSAWTANTTGNNEVGFKASVVNGPGDPYPTYDRELYTGASRIASFRWAYPTAPPANSTVAHTADFSGRLSVYIPAGAYPTSPGATASVRYDVFPVDWNTGSPGPDAERGNYSSRARSNAAGAATYTWVVNGTEIPNAPIHDIRQTVSGTRSASTPTSPTTQSVEVRIKGYAQANGNGIPQGTTLSSEASGSIRSIAISMR